MEQRSSEANNAKKFLEEVLTTAKEELKIATESLISRKNSVLQIVADTYDSEIRRNQQHFHQVEAAISDHIRHFDRYIQNESTSLSSLQRQMTTAPQYIVKILRFNVYDVDFAVAELIAGSVSRGELPLNRHLQVILSDQGRKLAADKLIKEAKASAESNDYLELQQAAAYSTEVLLLDGRDEAEAVNSHVLDLIQAVKDSQAEQLTKIITEDAESVQRLFVQLSEDTKQLKSFQGTRDLSVKFAEEIELCTCSMRSANLFRSIGDPVSIANMFGEDIEYHLSKKWLRKSFKILTRYFPNEIETGIVSAMLGLAYSALEKREKGLLLLNKGLPVLVTHSPNTLLRALVTEAIAVINEFYQNHSEAEKYYKDIITLPDNVSVFVQNRKIDTYLSLGKLYKRDNKIEQTEALYASILPTICYNFLYQKQIQIMGLWLGKRYLSTDRYAEAERCLKIAANVPPSYDIGKHLKIRRYLGETYFHLEQFAESKESYLAALSIATAEVPGSEVVGLLSSMLGIVCQKTFEFEESEGFYKKSIAILEVVAPNALNTGVVLMNLGNLFKLRGMNREAEIWVRKAVGVFELLGSQESLEQANSELEELRQLN